MVSERLNLIDLTFEKVVLIWVLFSHSNDLEYRSLITFKGETAPQNKT